MKPFQRRIIFQQYEPGWGSHEFIKGDFHFGGNTIIFVVFSLSEKWRECMIVSLLNAPISRLFGALWLTPVTIHWPSVPRWWCSPTRWSTTATWRRGWPRRWWTSASTRVRSTGSTGPTAKWFVFTSIEIRKWSCDIFNQFLRKQYFQCAKLIKEALDSRYEAAYLPGIWRHIKTTNK